MNDSSLPSAHLTEPGLSRVLFHVHTRHSQDAWIRPEQIVSFAREHQIGTVFVTDHDSMRGAISCARLSGAEGPVFPLSAEYRSTSGDMIAAMIATPIRAREPIAIIEETHAQGGVVILPHPFQRRPFPDHIVEKVDLIEIFNARCNVEQNSRAAALARDLGKPGIAGADAHFPGELALVWNEYRSGSTSDLSGLLKQSPHAIRCASTTARAIRQSQLLMAIRQLRPILAAKQIVRILQSDEQTKS